jgi:hypothetical protein
MYIKYYIHMTFCIYAYEVCIVQYVCVHMYVCTNRGTCVHCAHTYIHTCIMHLLKSYYCNALQPAKLLIQWITHTGSSYVVDQARGIQLKEFLT